MDALQNLQADNGGRPAANDDFITLQNRDVVLGLSALLLGLGPCVVSGCRVYQTGSVWNVAPGMVWDGVNLLPFPGRSNVSLPAMFAPGTVQVLDERAYQIGGTKTTIKGQSMDLVAVVAGAPNLVVDTYGALTFWHRMQEKTRSASQVEWLATHTPVNYDGDGLGKPGTEAWGWKLLLDAAGKFPVVLDTSKADYDTVGKTGGAESVTLDLTQIPTHSHPSDFRITDSRTGDTSQLTAGWTSTPTANGKNIITKSVGGGQSHENRPPFYVLAARQWIGY